MTFLKQMIRNKSLLAKTTHMYSQTLFFSTHGKDLDALKSSPLLKKFQAQMMKQQTGLKEIMISSDNLVASSLEKKILLPPTGISIKDPKGLLNAENKTEKLIGAAMSTTKTDEEEKKTWLARLKKSVAEDKKLPKELEKLTFGLVLELLGLSTLFALGKMVKRVFKPDPKRFQFSFNKEKGLDLEGKVKGQKANNLIVFVTTTNQVVVMSLDQEIVEVEELPPDHKYDPERVTGSIKKGRLKVCFPAVCEGTVAKTMPNGFQVKLVSLGKK